MEHCVKITVFTPTYNRAYIIGNLYRSLQRQTYNNFEWLIVDDGSSDNTEELVQQWLADHNSFLIRYYKQLNGGKCRAINRALDLAKGELFFTVDSDDYLTDDALEKIYVWERQLPKSSQYCGLAGNLGISAEKTMNTIFSSQYYDGTLLERYSKVDGERAIVLYTEIYRKYKYPCFAGENFMTEAVAWNRIAHDGYKMRFYNDIIWIYEYRKDGLTNQGYRLFMRNPKGYVLWLKEKAEFEGISLIKKKKIYYTITCEFNTIYTKKQITEYIDESIVWVNVYILMHSIMKKIKGIRDS